MRILVTGVSSGLGKFLSEMLDYDLVLWDRASFGSSIEPVHVIIHCAHDRKHSAPNFDMIRTLRKVPHSKLVYISSIDVYDFDEANEYAACKRECEILVRKYFDDYKIIRPSLMLGRQMRRNTISRMLLGEQLRLSAESMISCVSYGIVMREIDDGLDDLGRGAVAVGYGPMRLDDIADALGIEPKYGAYTYRARMPLDPGSNYTLREVENFRDWHLKDWVDANG